MLGKIIRHFLISLIFTIRPLFGPATCQFPISCTKYAEAQLQHEPFFKAIWHIIKRIFSCIPFTKPH